MINRGIAKRALFETRDDARYFLSRLVRQIRLGRIEVHAYCLMTTHFHLLVRSPLGLLSEAMRQAQNEHSRRFNRRKRRDGALIRGRFFSRPVPSREYRLTLLRYIDANAVRAGIVRSSGEYGLGSAAAYVGGSGPRWLSREWVEAEACLASGFERFTPAAYRVAFDARDAVERAEIDELVDARIARPAGKDPLEDLIGTAPRDVQAWLQGKARLADGHRVGLPVCGRLALQGALEQDEEKRGTWMIVEGRRTWRGAEVAWVGLLYDLCGLSWPEIVDVGDSSLSRVRRVGAAHRRLLGTDPAYASRAAELGHAAITRCIPLGSSTRGGRAVVRY